MGSSRPHSKKVEFASLSPLLAKREVLQTSGVPTPGADPGALGGAGPRLPEFTSDGRVPPWVPLPAPAPLQALRSSYAPWWGPLSRSLSVGMLCPWLQQPSGGLHAPLPRWRVAAPELACRADSPPGPGNGAMPGQPARPADPASGRDRQGQSGLPQDSHKTTQRTHRRVTNRNGCFKLFLF